MLKELASQFKPTLNLFLVIKLSYEKKYREITSGLFYINAIIGFAI